MDVIQLLLDYADEQDILLELNEKNISGNYPLILAVSNDRKEMVELLMEYATNHSIKLDMTSKDKKGRYPLLWAVNRNNIAMVRLLVDFACKNEIALEFRESDVKDISKINFSIIQELRKFEKEGIITSDIDGSSSSIDSLNLGSKTIIHHSLGSKAKDLLKACEDNKLEDVKSVLNESRDNSDTLNLNHIKNKDGEYPLMLAAFNDNISIAKLLIDYANEFNLVLDLNEKDRSGSYALLYATVWNNMEMVQLFIDYAKAHQLTLVFKESDNKESSKIDQAILNLIKEYEKEGIITSKSDDDDHHHIPKPEKTSVTQVKTTNSKFKANSEEMKLLKACENDKFDVVQSIISNSLEEKSVLALNEIKDKDGSYPLLSAAFNDNKDMVNLLIGYAEENNYILNLDDRDEKGSYPLLYATVWNNEEIIKSIGNYARSHKLVMEFAEKDNEDISKANPEIIKLLHQYKTEGILKVEFKEDGALSEKFKNLE
jgi:ankyrin repeat protein